MQTVLIYDIDNDRARAKVADACLDYGLQRIQFSAFFGDLTRNRLDELLMKIERLVRKHWASVEVFPLCDKDVRLRRTLNFMRLHATGVAGTGVGGKLRPKKGPPASEPATLGAEPAGAGEQAP